MKPAVERQAKYGVKCSCKRGCACVYYWQDMSRFKRIVLWCCLALIVLLIVLSIYGAFLGAERARRFFNCLPMVVYWIALALAILSGIVVFARLAKVPSLLLIHAGCVFVLVGGIWGSQAGHDIQKKFFGIDRIRTGRMAVFENTEEDRVVVADINEIERLPFAVRLNDFRIEYYEPGYLEIQDVRGRVFRIHADVGSELVLPNGMGRLEIRRKFENFRITSDGIAVDSQELGSNPALEVAIEDPAAVVSTRYVFERFGGHARPQDNFRMSYKRPVREYISDVEIVKDGRVVLAKCIEVNHPLRYGGYHLYQHSYDTEAGQYSVLAVVSDSGLVWVYAGYAMLCAGVVWQFWFRHLTRAIKGPGSKKVIVQEGIEP